MEHIICTIDKSELVAMENKIVRLEKRMKGRAHRYKKLKENEGAWEIECMLLAKMVLNAKNLEGLKETVRLNFPQTTPPSSNGRTPNFEFGDCGSSPRGGTKP